MAGIAIYCRTDTDGQESILEQRASIERLARAWIDQGSHKGSIIRIFEDDGFCDFSLSRPGLSLLRAEARAGALGLVIVANQSRFSRSTSQLFKLGRELLEAGIQAVSLNEKEDGRIESKSVFPHIEEAVSIMQRSNMQKRKTLTSAARIAVGD